MNDDLPDINPRGAVAVEDIRAFLIGMVPGWYTTGDLFPRYEAWARRENQVPVTLRVLGNRLSKMDLKKRWTHNHISLWRVTEELTAP